MIYGSLQAEFMETKYNSHIHRYGTFIFGKIIISLDTKFFVGFFTNKINICLLVKIE